MPILSVTAQIKQFLETAPFLAVAQKFRKQQPMKLRKPSSGKFVKNLPFSEVDTMKEHQVHFECHFITRSIKNALSQCFIDGSFHCRLRRFFRACSCCWLRFHWINGSSRPPPRFLKTSSTSPLINTGIFQQITLKKTIGTSRSIRQARQFQLPAARSISA